MQSEVKAKRGIIGKSGMAGNVGMKGKKGEKGAIGDFGDTGPVGPMGFGDSGLLYATHSQNKDFPPCPDGTSPLYNGYSLLAIHGDADSVTMDLGKVY